MFCSRGHNSILPSTIFVADSASMNSLSISIQSRSETSVGMRRREGSKKPPLRYAESHSNESRRRMSCSRNAMGRVFGLGPRTIRAKCWSAGQLIFSSNGDLQRQSRRSRRSFSRRSTGLDWLKYYSPPLKKERRARTSRFGAHLRKASMHRTPSTGI